MFENDMLEKRTNGMTIPDFNENIVKEFLRYIYKSEVLDDTKAMELYAIAAKYVVPEMKSICEEMIMENLDASNAIETFDLANLYNATAMKQAAFDEIKNMMPGVTLSDTLLNNPRKLQKLLASRQESRGFWFKLKPEVVKKNYLLETKWIKNLNQKSKNDWSH